MSNPKDAIYNPLTCGNTGKEFRLIDCLSCKNVCPEMTKVFKSPAKRRRGMVQGK